MLSNEFHFEENDTILSVSPDGIWTISAGDRRWHLNEADDFYRVWLLLEYPPERIFAKLDEMAQSVQSPRSFAFDKLVASALASSRNMINLGMEWVPYLTDHQRHFLLTALRDVVNSKLGSQRARHIARKYANQAS